MIVNPKIGQAVRIHYRKDRAAFMPLHGRVGVVTNRSKGPGPRNHEVEIAGTRYAIPCGNLMKVEA